MDRLAGVNRTQRLFLLIPVCLLLAVLAACGSSGGESSGDSAAATIDEIPVAELGTRWDTSNAETLQTLTRATGWHFVGEVVGLDHQEEIDLVPDVPGATPAPPVPGKPKPANDGPPPLPVSYWTVRVTEVISGDLAVGESVLIRQMGGLSERSDGSLIRVQFEDDPPLEPGTRYLFFTQASDERVAQTSPFKRMRVAGDGTYRAEEDWSNLGAMAEIASLSSPQAARSAIQAAAAGAAE